MKRNDTPATSVGRDTGLPAPRSPNGHHPPTSASPGASVYRLIGLVGGLFCGLLGIGGGSAIAPLLLLVGALRPAQVSGTTLATVLVISSIGAVTYAMLGNVDLQIALPIASGSVVGSVLGALTARRLSMRMMVGIFLVIMPYFALKEFWPSMPAPALATSQVSLGLLGFATGYFSGLLGISGASLVVPSLVAFFLIDHHAAQGIAIGVAMADSAAGVATHARAKNIDYRVLSYMAPVAFVASIAGALLSNSLPVPVLRFIFGGFVTIVWFAMLGRMAKDLLASRARSPNLIGTARIPSEANGASAAEPPD